MNEKVITDEKRTEAVNMIAFALIVALAMGAVLICGAITEPDYRPCEVCGAQVAITPEPALNHWISSDSVVCDDCWKMLITRC